MTDKKLTIKEASAVAGVSTRTINRYIESGKVRAVKVFGKWRIDESEIQRLMAGVPNKAQEKA